MSEDVILTAHELAARWKVNVWSVYAAVKRGTLPHLRVGKRLRFHLAEIEQVERQGDIQL